MSRIDHLITSIDPARMSSEEVENPELSGSQRDLLAINRNKVSSWMDLKRNKKSMTSWALRQMFDFCEGRSEYELKVPGG